MGKQFNIELTGIVGQKRQTEDTDRPFEWPMVVKDIQIDSSGHLVKRQGYRPLYNKRHNHFFAINRGDNRELSSVTLTGDLEEFYYTSHKRKTICLGTDGTDQYVFQAFVLDSRKDGSYAAHKLLVARGLVSGQQVEWDAPVTIVNLPHNYASIDVRTGCWIEFSMVMDSLKEKISLACVLRDDSGGAGSQNLLNVYELKTLYDADFATSVAVTLLDGDSLVNIDQTASNDRLTRDIDIAIDASDRLHLVFGYWDDAFSRYVLKYVRYRSDVWSAQRTLGGAAGYDLYGCVIEVSGSGASELKTFGYLRHSVSSDDLRFQSFLTSSDNIFSTNESISSTVSTGVFADASVLNLFGAALRIDIDSTIVWGYKKDAPEKLYVKIGNNAEVSAAEDLYAGGTASSGGAGWFSGGGFPFSGYMGWDLIAKDGVALAIYDRKRLDGSYELVRRSCVFDNNDRQYSDGVFSDAELIERQLPVNEGNVLLYPRHTFVTAYPPYDSATPKHIGGILFDGDRSTAFYDRVDRDISGMENLYGIRQLYEFPSRTLTGIENVLVIQCGDNHFYRRGSFQWDLLRGQRDDANFLENPDGTTEIDGRAFMWHLYQTLRAGVGIGEGNDPVRYGWINRYNYGNDEALRIRDNYFTLAACPPPRVEDVVVSIENVIIREDDPPAQAHATILVDDDALLPFGGKAVFTVIPTGVETNLYALQFNAITNPDGTFRITCDVLYNGNSLGQVFADHVPLASIFADVCAGVVNVFGNLFSVKLTGDTTMADPGAGTISVASLASGGAGDTRYQDFFTALPGDDRPCPSTTTNANGDRILQGFNPPALVEHSFRNVVLNPSTGSEEIRQPFIEGFLGFAFRYDNGQLSQISPQSSDSPYRLGFVVTDGQALPADLDEFDGLGIRCLRVTMRTPRWDWIGTIGNPRITGICLFWGEQTKPGMDKYEVLQTSHIIKEVLVAKTDRFKDEPQNGDSEWMDEGFGNMVISTIVDYGTYTRNVLTSERADIFTGIGVPVAKDAALSPVLEGYKYATALADRPIYANIRRNGEERPNHLVFAGDATQFGETITTPDIVPVDLVKSFNYTLNGVTSFGDGNIIVAGNSDLVVGSIGAVSEGWQLRDTIQDLGLIAPRSLAKIADTGGGDRLGLFMLMTDGGGRLFNLANSSPMTDEVLLDAVCGTNPAGVRVVTTYNGVTSLVDGEAMALFLPASRLFFLHFPTDGITMVRDFKAEDLMANSGKRSGTCWSSWEFAHNPLAWCSRAEGDMVFTDEANIYQWPDPTSGGTDAGAAIVPFIRSGSWRLPPFVRASSVRATMDYKSVGSGVSVKLVKDDGNQRDKIFAFPVSSVRQRKSVENGIGGGFAQEQVALEITPSDAEACSAFEFSALRLDFDLEGI